MRPSSAVATMHCAARHAASALCRRPLQHHSTLLQSTRRSFSSKPPSSSAAAHGPINLALMGAPGVGKGTFANRLAPLFGIPTISTGDLIRAEIKAGSDVGRAVQALTEGGGLVSDDVVLSLLEKRLSAPDAQKGFIIDGYPRRVSQAVTLGERHPLALAVNLVLDEGVLLEKALARRVCAKCGAGYNLASIMRDGFHMPPLLPKVAGVCDKCGSTELVTRADDTEPVIRERLRVYREETHPIVDFYRKQGVLMDFHVKKGVADLPELHRQILERINK